MRRRTEKKIRKLLILVILICLLDLLYYAYPDIFNKISFARVDRYDSILEVEDYHGKGYAIINDNNPEFKDEDKTTNSFEKYSRLDLLGRCGAAYANISIDTMPTEERGPIGQIKPTAWQISKYDFIEGKYLYNRCHLIGYQLTAENANKRNLITCTRYMNSVTMLEFENMVASYVKRTHNHVLYRVTPIFKGTNMLASGVQMEAFSVEDDGRGIKFNVYVYNIQDNVEIDYRTGANRLKENK